MSYREGIDTTPGGFPYRQAPHGYCGSNSDRQSVGDPGHCEDCCSVGHIVAHPDLGCADVGCYSDHVDEPVSVSPDPPGLPPVCATCGNPITHTGAGYRHVNPILNVLTEHEATPEEGAQVAREQTVHTNTSVTGITDEMIELGAQAIAEEIGMRGQLYPVESPDFPAHRRRVAEAVLRGALARRAVVDHPTPDGENDGVSVWTVSHFDVEARGDTVWFAWHSTNRPGRNMGPRIIRSLAGALLAALAENERLAAVQDVDNPPRRWPVGSPEPKESGLRVQSTQNGVIFKRWPQEPGRWLAEPDSGGDGQDYTWHSMNSENAAEGGMEFVEVVSGVAGGGARHD